MHRIILITGTTRGLGLAMAEKFRELGHTVLGCGRSADDVARLEELMGPPHRFRSVDISDDSAVQAWAQELLPQLGPPDLLLNNAALMNRTAPLWELSAAEFDPIVDVNIKGLANVIRHFVPAMVQRGQGVIVNFSSGWGRSTAAEVAPYCASKFAVEGLTKALAQELPRGMAAVPLNPGIIDTDMLRSAWGEGAGSYPQPRVWAERAVPFLLNLGAKDNGQSLSVR